MIADTDKKSVRQIFGKIFVITLVAVFFACAVIAVSNDIYAFVKKDISIRLQLNEPVSIKQFSNLLEENGIVNNGFIFTAYTRLKDKVGIVEDFEGEISLNSSMSYREILSQLSNNAK